LSVPPMEPAGFVATIVFKKKFLGHNAFCAGQEPNNSVLHGLQLAHRGGRTKSSNGSDA